jgi:hypothetical protein
MIEFIVISEIPGVPRSDQQEVVKHFTIRLALQKFLNDNPNRIVFSIKEANTRS